MTQQSKVKYYRSPIPSITYKVNHTTGDVYLLREVQKDFLLLPGRTWTSGHDDTWYKEISEEEIALEML